MFCSSAESVLLPLVLLDMEPLKVCSSEPVSGRAAAEPVSALGQQSEPCDSNKTAPSIRSARFLIGCVNITPTIFSSPLSAVTVANHCPVGYLSILRFSSDCSTRSSEAQQDCSISHRAVRSVAHSVARRIE